MPDNTPAPTPSPEPPKPKRTRGVFNKVYQDDVPRTEKTIATARKDG